MATVLKQHYSSSLLCYSFVLLGITIMTKFIPAQLPYMAYQDTLIEQSTKFEFPVKLIITILSIQNFGFLFPEIALELYSML